MNQTKPVGKIRTNMPYAQAILQRWEIATVDNPVPTKGNSRAEFKKKVAENAKNIKHRRPQHGYPTGKVRRFKSR